MSKEGTLPEPSIQTIPQASEIYLHLPSCNLTFHSSLGHNTKQHDSRWKVILQLLSNFSQMPVKTSIYAAMD